MRCGCAGAAAADPDPSAGAKAAEVLVTSPPARTRKQPPAELPADIVESAKERSADRK